MADEYEYEFSDEEEEEKGIVICESASDDDYKFTVNFGLKTYTICATPGTEISEIVSNIRDVIGEDMELGVHDILKIRHKSLDLTKMNQSVSLFDSELPQLSTLNVTIEKQSSDIVDFRAKIELYNRLRKIDPTLKKMPDIIDKMLKTLTDEHITTQTIINDIFSLIETDELSLIEILECDDVNLAIQILARSSSNPIYSRVLRKIRYVNMEYGEAEKKNEAARYDNLVAEAAAFEMTVEELLEQRARYAEMANQ